MEKTHVKEIYKYNIKSGNNLGFVLKLYPLPRPP